MAITVHLPSALRPECGGLTELSLTAATARDALVQLEQLHPAVYRSICDETGAVRRHINLFVNEDYLNQRNGLDTVLEPGDVLTIMPAVSGG